jgi:peptidoglycan/LPS O-acetylase OafA/YrhL
MKYTFINSARGIAIIMVIIVHASQLYHFKNSAVKLFFEYGQMGVQLFFIASAYTLCLSSAKRREEKKTITNFYIRRFFRIFPIYYLGIILYFLLNFYFKEINNYSLKNIGANITFIHGMIPSANNTIVPGGWSIGTEMIFYMIFPFLHKFFLGNFTALKYILAIVLCFLTVNLLNSNFENNSFWYFNIITQLPVFLTGIVYFKYEKKVGLFFAILLFVSFTFISLYLWNVEQFMLVPLASGLSFCGLLKILEKTLLDLKILQKIGEVSYSIYITHFVLVFYLLHPVLRFREMIFYIILTICICYPFALFLEKYLEKPFIKLGNKIITSRNLALKRS